MAYKGLPDVVASGGTGATTLTGVLIGNGTSAVTGNAITQHDVLIGGASNAITSLAPSATSGVAMISQGAAADPAFGTVVVAGGGTGAVTLTGVLTGNGTSAVTASTVTQHGVIVGGASNAVASTAVGSTGQVLQANTGADPTYSTATYPATTTVSQLLYSSATNVVSGLATANRAVITTNSTGVPVATALATDGQVIIGSTAGAPAAATLTAGTNITITNASNSITIASTGAASFTWSVVTADASFTVNTGTIANKAGLLTMTLPASAAIGDTIAITGINTALGWKIAQNANQQIFFGTTSTTVGVGGSLASSAIRDSLRIVCVVSGASTVYNVVDSVGNITVV